MNNVIVTKHARERIRKRIGIPNKVVERKAIKAFYLGSRVNEACGALNKFMSRCNDFDRWNHYCVVYGNFMYIFHRNILITVYGVPSEIRHMRLKNQNMLYA